MKHLLNLLLASLLGSLVFACQDNDAIVPDEAEGYGTESWADATNIHLVNSLFKYRLDTLSNKYEIIPKGQDSILLKYNGQNRHIIDVNQIGYIIPGTDEPVDIWFYVCSYIVSECNYSLQDSIMDSSGGMHYYFYADYVVAASCVYGQDYGTAESRATVDTWIESADTCSKVVRVYCHNVRTTLGVGFTDAIIEYHKNQLSNLFINTSLNFE